MRRELIEQVDPDELEDAFGGDEAQAAAQDVLLKWRQRRGQTPEGIPRVGEHVGERVGAEGQKGAANPESELAARPTD